MCGVFELICFINVSNKTNENDCVVCGLFLVFIISIPLPTLHSFNRIDYKQFSSIRSKLGEKEDSRAYDGNCHKMHVARTLVEWASKWASKPSRAYTSSSPPTTRSKRRECLQPILSMKVTGNVTSYNTSVHSCDYLSFSCKTLQLIQLFIMKSIIGRLKISSCKRNYNLQRGSKQKKSWQSNQRCH